MVMIYRDTVSHGYPTVTHKVIRGNSIEQLCCCKDVLGYIISGSKKIGDVECMSAGDLFFLTANNFNINYICDIESGIYEEVFITFNMDDLRDMIYDLIPPYIISSYLISADNSVVVESLNEMASENIVKVIYKILKYDEYKSEFPLLQESINRTKLVDLILTILYSENSSIAIELVKLLNSGNNRLRAMVTEYFNFNIKIDEIAEKCGMSTSQFNKIFNTVYGNTPHRWLLIKQLEQAAFLIKENNLSIGDIAVKCGFSNASHLTKRFKEHFNTTPREYKKIWAYSLE